MQKRAITLIEVMIVIVLIGIISGALAYNMRGGLDKGKKFKTDQGIAQIESILELERAEGKDVSNTTWQDIIKKSQYVKNPDRLIVDGWNKEYVPDISEQEIKITSSYGSTS